MKILAATDFSTRSNRAVRQSGLLAQLNKTAHLSVVHVVDDDQPDALVRLEQREAERILEEQLASMPELQSVQAQPIVATGDPFVGILRVAQEVRADLIVMGSHRKQMLLDIFTGTTIERVARKGTYPVLMVNHEAQRKYTNVVAAIVMTDSSANALQVALATGLISETGATLLHAFFAAAKGKMYIGGADRESMDAYVEKQRQLALDEVVRFLSANNLQQGRWFYRINEGAPMEVISQVVAEMRPDLLVMGTHGRSAFSKVLMGSVTEEALRSLNVDILVVPPVKR